MAVMLFFTVLMILVLTSCKHEPIVLPKINTETGNNNVNQQSTCDPDSAYFQSQVLPILISNCAKSGCHNVQDHEEGVILNNYANVMATADVDPGRPGNSDLYDVITENDIDKRMPPAPANRLSDAQIDIIFKWIDQGAQNNTCNDICDTSNVTFSGSIFPLIQSNCIGCHTGSTAGGQVDLSSYQNISIVANNGKLLASVNHDIGVNPMPKGGNKLPACRIDQIRIWIQNGAQNN